MCKACVVGLGHAKIGHATDVAEVVTKRSCASNRRDGTPSARKPLTSVSAKTFATFSHSESTVPRLLPISLCTGAAVEKRIPRTAVRAKRTPAPFRPAGRKVLERFRGRLERRTVCGAVEVGFDRQPLRWSGGHVADAELDLPPRRRMRPPSVEGKQR